MDHLNGHEIKDVDLLNQDVDSQDSHDSQDSQDIQNSQNSQDLRQDYSIDHLKQQEMIPFDETSVQESPNARIFSTSPWLGSAPRLGSVPGLRNRNVESESPRGRTPAAKRLRRHIREVGLQIPPKVKRMLRVSVLVLTFFASIWLFVTFATLVTSQPLATSRESIMMAEALHKAFPNLTPREIDEMLKFLSKASTLKSLDYDRMGAVPLDPMIQQYNGMTHEEVIKIVEDRLRL